MSIVVARELRAMSQAMPAASGGRMVIGIGEFAVSKSASDVIVTHALGSCIAVCLWDPEAHVAGLLHFLLPDAAINAERARTQPAAFANTGIPMLFQAAYGLGLDKQRCKVKLVGGAEVSGMAGAGSLNVGKRNLLAARNILWRNGVLIAAEATGGSIPRTVALQVGSGVLEVTSGRERIGEV